MDATLHALGQILVKAAPTFLLILCLHLYLKNIFFKPLGEVLKKRYDATEGARKLAEESMQRATAKTAEYDVAIRAARAEVYQAQEKQYRVLQDELAAQMVEAHSRSEERLGQARARIAADAAQAKGALASESELLAARIADAILRRSAA